MKNSGLIFNNTTMNIDNEVNIIETNTNKKYKKKKRKKKTCSKKLQTQQSDFGRKKHISQALSSHTPTLQIYIIIHNQFSIDPNQFTHQHFRSISSSTINLQILTKKKQIRGNKVPNDGDGDEAQSELRRGQGREVEISVRE